MSTGPSTSAERWAYRKRVAKKASAIVVAYLVIGVAVTIVQFVLVTPAAIAMARGGGLFVLLGTFLWPCVLAYVVGFYVWDHLH